MTSAPGGMSNRQKRKIWDESPNTFTEFGALSSEMKPSGGFFSRLWKRNKDDPSQTGAAFDDEPAAETLSHSRSDSDISVSAASGSRGATPPPIVGTLSYQSARSSITSDADTVSRLSASDKNDQSEEVLETQVSSSRVAHRTLSSVLNRLGSILDHRSATPQTYKDSDFKQYWMPDSSCRECYDCSDKFTTFRRRHHCRICGQIFCSKCCNQELPGKIIGYKGGIRVCTYCCRVVQRYAQQSASTGDYRALEELRAISQSCNESGSFDFGRRSVSPKLSLGMEDLNPQIRGDSLPDLPGIIPTDMNTPFDLTPQSEFSSQDSLLLESKLLIQDSLQLRELWRQVCDIEAGVEIQSIRIRLRTHQNCIVGKELVDWLIKRDKATTRDQAMAIGQALLYAGYLDSVGHQSLLFKDDFTLYRPGETALALDILGEPEAMPTITEVMEKNEPLWFQEIGRAGDDDDDEVDGHPLTLSTPSDDPNLTLMDSEGHKSYSSESDTKTLLNNHQTSRSGSFSEMPKPLTLISRDILDEPLPRQDSSVHGLGDEFLKGALFLRNPPIPSSDVVACPHGWRSVDQLREENGEKLAYERLKRAHTGLWHALTRQMLSEQCLLLSWEMVIYTCITQISHFVRPDVRMEGDDMDIRNYVHIKKVSGGNKSDTTLFHGVVFTKNIAHKKMKTKIANPLILLLRGTIEFQRVENKFSSLEPQILQEREFMRNCVMKMIAYRPNVVVVEKSVSRLAQEYLLEAGITLLYNVKPSVMERLARFTQADIVPSIDGLVSKPNMGFCHDFRLQTFTLANQETKTLAVFDGCATHLGCTIVLRGGSPSELRRVKHILKFMTYTAYNSLLELCFCMDEFAMPQPGADELEQPFEGLDSSTEQSLPDGCGSKKEGSSFDEKHLTEKKVEEDENDNDSCGRVEFQIEADVDQELEVMEYQNQSKRGMSTFLDKDADASSMDYRGERKSTFGSEQSSSSEFEVKEDGFVSQGRERSFCTQNENEGFRKDTWYDSPGLSLLACDSEQETDVVRMVSSENVVSRSEVKDLNEEKTKPTFDQNRLEMALPCEDHFNDDDDTPGIYAVTTAATVPIPHEVVTTLADIATTSVAMEPISTVTLSDHRISFAQREKIRHLSGMSIGDNMSGRSTPDYILRADNTDKSGWDGSPKLIGNIMCIIPKSSLPIIVGGPPQAATENCIESDSIDCNNINVASTINEPQERDFNQTCSVEDNVFISSDTKADNGCETHIADLPQRDSLPNSSLKLLGDENSLTTLKKTERSGSLCCQNRPSTSILTELTDFSDPLLGYQNTQDESIFNSANTLKIALKEIKQTNYKRFRKALDGVHLSVSPYHKYSVPFIETDKGFRCSVRKYLPDEIFWSRLFDGEESQWQTKSKAADAEVSAKTAAKNNIQILDAHSLITCKLTEPVWDNNTQTLLADFRARGGRIQLVTDNGKQPQIDAGGKKGDDSQGLDYATSGLLWEKKIDCLDPTNHQKLMVLFSSYSYKSANHPYPCVYPWVVTMEFYGRNDITLGGFLERFCFRKQYSCPSPTCDTPMTDHVRRFVHGSSCINVLLKKLDNEVPGGKENILMWSWCRKCKQVTPVVPISGDTWNLSFAKYLDLRFHSSSFLRRGSAEPCPHSLHHDHFQYFGHRNIVASFKQANICLKEVALPATCVSLQPATFDVVSLAETVKNITYKATDRYSLMLENTMKLKQELTVDTHIRAISEILLEQQNDKKNFRDSATNIQMKINELIHSVTNVASIGQTDCDMTFHLYAIFDNMELLKRKICEDVTNWNTRMQEFMLLQQKKPRAQVSNKKDKDSGQSAAEELDKSWKAGSDRSSKSSIPPSPASLSSSGPFSQQPPPSPTPAKAQISVLTQASVVSKTSEDSSDVSSAVNGNNPSTESSLNSSITTAASSTALSATIPEVRITDSSSLSPSPGAIIVAALAKDSTTPAGEGIEDTTDGWFQDLKGATRRWLSTSSFTPLPLPFEPCEHHTLPICEKVPVAVYDHEPSSIISYALSSSDYLCRLKEIQTATRTNSSDLTTGSSQLGKPTSKPDPVSIISATTEAFVETGRKAGGGVLSFLRGNGGSRDPSPHHNPHSSHHKVEAAVRYVPGTEWGDVGGIQEDVDMTVLSDEATPSPEEKPKVGSAAPSPHIELQFSDSAAKFYCRVYFADQFRKLRKLIFPGSDNIFIRSLSRCKSWEAKGGKSGSSFSKTVDDRFILKQMSSMEVESFEKFGPQYFQYMKLSMSEQQPTALAKIMGVFRIGFRNTQTNHALRQDVLVMENLFYNRKISQKFDLKGSMRNRLVNTNSKRAEDELVLLDENLLKCSVENPLYLRPHSKHVLKSAITNDSAFLSTNLVMDYSLLVGVDEDTQELVVGIIDYIRTFTWDKRLEMVVKSTGILGGQGKMPTVVSPQLYRGRFLEAMDRYFLHVPDNWMGLGKDFPSHQYKLDT